MLQKGNPALSFDSSCVVGEGATASAQTFPTGNLVVAFISNAVNVVEGNTGQENGETEKVGGRLRRIGGTGVRTE